MRRVFWQSLDVGWQGLGTHLITIFGREVKDSLCYVLIPLLIKSDLNKLEIHSFFNDMTFSHISEPLYYILQISYVS